MSSKDTVLNLQKQVRTVITVSAFKSDFRNLIFLSDPAVNNLQQRHAL